jgi:hypothetical protein
MKLQKFSAPIHYYRNFNSILANLHSKFEYPPIMKIVFPEIMKNFYIGQF